MNGTLKATNGLQKREHVTREVGFFWQVYKPLNGYWSETMVSLKVAEPNQPTTDNCRRRSANSLPTVVNFFLLLLLTTTVNSSFNNNCRSDYYRHSSSMNVHIRSDKLAHKQSAPKTLRLRHSPITKGKFHLIQLWCRFVAHLHGVFTDIAHYCRAQ